MIHTAAPRSLRAGVAVVGIAGTIALAGCSGAVAETSNGSSGSTSGTSGSSTTGTGSSSGGGTYTDGTYTAQGTYATPESVETLSVTVTLKDDVITDVEVSGNPQKHESVEYQSRFIGGIADVVVGQDIDKIAVSRVAGSSLTSGGFNEAIQTIKAEAAA
ncbi:hypothetical protein [Microbacterium deminutum]|uniref:FMN-binding domain-containing protein n=1 Tax=Microbacterium deminutum TaxID=344164 RepID=A0ABP5CQF1_9MICO